METVAMGAPHEADMISVLPAPKVIPGKIV